MAEQIGGVQTPQQHASDIAGKLRLSVTIVHVEALSEPLLLLFGGSLRQHGGEMVVFWSSCTITMISLAQRKQRTILAVSVDNKPF